MDKLEEQIKQMGLQTERLRGPKKRLYIKGLDGIVNKEEIIEGITKVTQKGEQIRVIFLREGFAGTQTACVELNEVALRTCLRLGAIGIGLMKCPVREYVISKECYKCGKQDTSLRNAQGRGTCAISAERLDISGGYAQRHQQKGKHKEKGPERWGKKGRKHR